MYVGYLPHIYNITHNWYYDGYLPE